MKEARAGEESGESQSWDCKVKSERDGKLLLSERFLKKSKKYKVRERKITFVYILTSSICGNLLQGAKRSCWSATDGEGDQLDEIYTNYVESTLLIPNSCYHIKICDHSINMYFMPETLELHCKS